MHDFRVTVTHFFLATQEKEPLALFRFLSNLFNPTEITMTQNQFNALCNEHCIDPSLALENENLIEALRERDDDRVIEIITQEF